VIPASREVVWAAMVEGEEVARWFGPAGFSVPSIEFDPRVGQSYRIEMQPPEGEPFFIAGEFRKVDAPARLAFTFRYEDPDQDDIENTADISLDDRGEATEIRFVQGPFKTEARLDLHNDGWSDTLDKLEGLVSSTRP
jgi:uncharacterized protein YndB with AHSA1/START domain